MMTRATDRDSGIDRKRVAWWAAFGALTGSALGLFANAWIADLCGPPSVFNPLPCRDAGVLIAVAVGVAVPNMETATD